MDEFSLKIKSALEIAGKKLLFEKIDKELFELVEKTVGAEINTVLGGPTVIRWTDHALKIAKHTFSSTFIIKDFNGVVRKFTISPEVTLKFDDLKFPDNEVTDQVKNAKK